MFFSGNNTERTDLHILLADDDEDWQDEEDRSEAEHGSHEWEAFQQYAHHEYEPWSSSWYRWCEARYESFAPDSGTFIDRDGEEHFCVAR